MRRVLIANRGEIALRIARGCHARGLEAVAVYSDADRDAPHARAADRAEHIGPSPARESYLLAERLLDVARRTDCDAVHPGYGFLSENAAFARAVRDAGLTWIGPSPESIATMGDKIVARQTAGRAGVPLVPGVELAVDDPAAVAARAREIGYPVLVKAAAGGGGKGMRIVQSEAELRDALASAAREAQSAFADGRVYLEKLLLRPRHVEVQVFGDEHGRLVHLGERECSIQRRHQKIVEESPCPVMTPALRTAMTDAALAAARAVDYVGAGTVEFLLAEDGAFYFLEMNTRLQVEHPVTEWVTGRDLVDLQLRVAAGERLGFGQEDVSLRGHAIEVRVYAEDPAAGFLPSPGAILALREPQGVGVRVDSGIDERSVVPMEYDPMLSKISAWGPDRDAAIGRLIGALRETAVVGPTTNVAFLIDVLDHAAFRGGASHTGFLAEHLPTWATSAARRDAAALAAALALESGGASADDGGGAQADPSPFERLGAWRLRA